MLRAFIRAAAPLTHLALAMGVLTVVACSSVIVTTSDLAPGLGGRLVIAAGVGAAAGLLLGLLQSVVWGGLVLVTRRMGLGQWWARVNNRDPASAREPTVAFHAAVTAAVLMVVLFGEAVWMLMPRLLHIDDPGFARSFAVIVFIGLVAGATFGGLVMARLLRPLFARLDARVRLPWPGSPVLRYALVITPLALLLPQYLLVRAEDLGTFALAFWLLLLLLAEGLVMLAWRAFVPPAAAWRLLQRVAPALAVAGALAASMTMNASEDTARWAGHHKVLRPTVALLSRLTDVDRDGFSSMFGGGDCAPTNGSINPKATDLPGNGIDEDCSGEDATVASRDHLQLFYGRYAPPEGRERLPNVIFIIIDAVRADTTGVGGARRSPTPYLDEAAEDSLSFTRAYSQSSATMISIPSMLAGQDPSTIAWKRGKRIELNPDQQTLGRRLKALGYRTMVIGTDYFETHLTRTLEEFEEHRIVSEASSRRQKAPGGSYFTGRSAGVVTEAIRFLEQGADSDTPAFVTLYFPEPHAGYKRHGFGLSKYGKKKKDLYTGEVANADRSLGFLVHYLKHSGQWDDTIFIVVADHGEEFEEHGGKAHARTCYVESTHVPLVMHIPGVDGQKIKLPVGLHDIAPTVLEVLGATEDPGTMDGQSLLVPALAPELVPEDRVLPCAVISQRTRQGNFFRRAARSRDRLLVHNVLEGTYELYETKKDRKEKKNLYDAKKGDPPVVDLRAYLEQTLTGNLAHTLITD